MKPRLSPLEIMAIGAFTRSVRGRFGARVERLSLFGSRARGEGRDDSDLDLFIAIRGMTRDDRREVLDAAADVGVEYGLALSPLVVDPSTWREDLPIASSIARDGVPL
jgi:uncharacterized protein